VGPGNAIDILVRDYAADFGGEDPLRPQLRELLSAAKDGVEALAPTLQSYVGAWELPNDFGDALGLVRELEQRVLG
jgi:hypothetical protein